MKPFLCVLLCASLFCEGALAKPQKGGSPRKSVVTRAAGAQLLRRADKNWSENSQQIKAMVSSALKSLKTSKLNDTSNEVLSASLLVDARGGLKFSEWSAAYITLRKKGQSKRDAGRNLAALYRSLIEGN